MGTFTPDPLTGSQHCSQQNSAQFLSESFNMKDKTTRLLFKTQKESFWYWVWAKQNSSNAWDNKHHTTSQAFLFVYKYNQRVLFEDGKHVCYKQLNWSPTACW